MPWSSIPKQNRAGLEAASCRPRPFAGVLACSPGSVSTFTLCCYPLLRIKLAKIGKSALAHTFIYRTATWSAFVGMGSPSRFYLTLFHLLSGRHGNRPLTAKRTTGVFPVVRFLSVSNDFSVLSQPCFLPIGVLPGRGCGCRRQRRFCKADRHRCRQCRSPWLLCRQSPLCPALG